VGEIYNNATVSDCYWNTQTTGTSSGYGTITSGGTFSGSGLTTVQMKLQSSFSGWNFSTVWSISPSINNGYPYLMANVMTSVEAAIGTPKTFSLLQNFPNPFNPTTTISFYLPSKSFVSLTVFDIVGRKIATIISEEMSPGTYSRQWNAAKLSSGIYFYRLQAGTYIETKKLVLLK
jgi:hypothetical protein